MMVIELPSKFVQATRWAYLQDGIEVGPYDANEIVQLLGDREIAPDTTLIELNTRRMCPVSEVGPFARVIVDIVHESRRRKADQDFETSTREVASGGRRRVILVTILVLAAVGVGGAALFIYNPFAVAPSPEGPHEEKIDAGAEQEEANPSNVPQKEQEPVFKITEMDPAELEPDPASEMIESVLEEKQLNPNAERLSDDQKLAGLAKPEEPKEPRHNGVHKAKTGAEAATGDSGAEAGIQSMNFTEEEIAVGDGPTGPDDTLAIGRLRKVMRACVERSLHNFPEGAEVLIDAQARLQPDGRLTGLKIDLMPRKAVGEIKMCVSAELMRMRVPAFEGKELKISTALAVPGR